MKIYFLNGSRNGQKIQLSGERIRIGRETDNDITLETDGVSRYHAELIKLADENWQLKDLGSTNGSKINKELVKGEKALVEGDIVTLGDQHFRYGEKKAEAPGIPVIQPGEKIPADNKVVPIIETPAVEKNTEIPPPVQKIIFEPLPKKAQHADETVKKSIPPIIEPMKTEQIIETVKPNPEEPLMTAKELSESAANIFGTQKKKPKTEKQDSTPAVRKHLFNALFYLVLLVGVVIFVFWFLNSNNENKRTTAVTTVKEKEIPLMLYYVKDKISKDNVFRFSLLIENNVANFVIDDLESDRHYNKTIKNIKPEFSRALKNSIKDTGFMNLQPISRGSAVNNLDEIRQMTIALNNKYNSITIQNNSAPASFQEIERAIEDFADAYDLLTFAMTPEELQKRAKTSFAKAEEYYANRAAMPGNLLEAERRYKMTVDYLDQFSPKPEMWDIASKRYAEVKAMRHKRWDELRYEVERLERLGKIKDVIEALDEMIQLADQDSEAYKWARKKKNRFSERLNERKK